MPEPSAALISLLQSLPIFGGLGDHEVSSLAQLSQQKLFAAGTVIFQHGEPGVEAYVVIRGSIAIHLPGREQPIATVGAGQIFGELAFLDGQQRTAEARAVEPSILLVLTREAFDALCLIEPNFGRIVMHNIALDLSAKLRRTNLALAV